MIYYFEGSLWLPYQQQTLELSRAKSEAVLQQSSKMVGAGSKGLVGDSVVNGIWVYFEDRGSMLFKNV